MTHFEQDPYPGRPKLLVIAEGYSSHARDWIDTLADAQFNIRFFAMPHHNPPDDWPGKTYVTGLSWTEHIQESDTRKRLFPTLPPKTDPRWLPKRLELRRIYRNYTPEKWLAEIIQTWRPDIIQTLSFSPAARYFHQVYQDYNLQGISIWASMIFGGSDIELEKSHPEQSAIYRAIMRDVDYVFGDTEQCIISARELGLREEQIPPHYSLPAAGGVDAEGRFAEWKDRPPSKRERIILWAKAYDGFYVSSPAVMEALKICWEDIQPARLIIPGIREHAERWYYKLPEHIRAQSQIMKLLPHPEFAALMKDARVMLAPSMLDGTPNTLVDALSYGAFPVVSPLADLKSFLESEKNVLFARNLYPHEMATAITRAMHDDALVDAAAYNNVDVVRRVANRPVVRRKIIENYESMLANRSK